MITARADAAISSTRSPRSSGSGRSIVERPAARCGRAAGSSPVIAARQRARDEPTAPAADRLPSATSPPIDPHLAAEPQTWPARRRRRARRDEAAVSTDPAGHPRTLLVGPAVARGPQPEPAELPHDVRRGALEPRARRVAAHHRIVGDDLDPARRSSAVMFPRPRRGARCLGGERLRYQEANRRERRPVIRRSWLPAAQLGLAGALRLPLRLRRAARPAGRLRSASGPSAPPAAAAGSVRRRPSGLPSPTGGREGIARSGGAIRGVGRADDMAGAGTEPRPPTSSAGAARLLVAPPLHARSPDPGHVLAAGIGIAEHVARPGTQPAGDTTTFRPRSRSGRGSTADRRRSPPGTGLQARAIGVPLVVAWRRRGSRSRRTEDSRSAAPRSRGRCRSRSRRRGRSAPRDR